MSMFRELLMTKFSPYQKLQYLESTGVQWIDTGITPIIGDTASVRCMPLANSTGNAFGTAVPGYYTSYFAPFVWTSYELMAYMRGVFPYQNTIGLPLNTWYKANIHCLPNVTGWPYTWQAFLYDDQDVLISQTTELGSDAGLAARNTMTVFCTHLESSPAEFFVGRISSAKITGVNNIDLIPVLWNKGVPYTDGNTGLSVTPTAAKPGMYDLVSKKLYVNQGTGADFSYA